VLAGIIGIAFAFFLFYKVSLISVQPSDSGTTLKTLKRSEVSATLRLQLQLPRATQPSKPCLNGTRARCHN
jgi:hypothetical protein